MKQIEAGYDLNFDEAIKTMGHYNHEKIKLIISQMKSNPSNYVKFKNDLSYLLMVDKQFFKDSHPIGHSQIIDKWITDLKIDDILRDLPLRDRKEILCMSDYYSDLWEEAVAAIA